ncbi:ABC transporter substrate-binding protein [Nocardioides sp. R-C-SC26]|uniref:ABC transporter substrate-binding protein n=1 Tax=Nocardioides sp. R-C-SC26 TaxID=2870414 RepID=UPI001E2DC453|nr:ABC transporter substrate-binding protein [Nocardioides sp. R-C-SC26]
MTRSPHARLRPLGAGLIAAAVLTVTACGSQLSADEVAAARGGDSIALESADTGSSGEVVGATGDPGAIGGDTGTTSGDPGAPVAGGTGGGTGSTSTGGDTGGASGGTTGESPAAPSEQGTSTGPCDLPKAPGITDSEIVIANASDISGAVPGLFKSSQDAMLSYVNYFNRTSDICGRKLKLLELDSRGDAAADQQNYARACTEAFAMVGSTSIVDSGGAATAQNCKLPDLRALALTRTRTLCSTCYSAQAQEIGVAGNYTYKEIERLHPGVKSSAAFLYLNTGGSPDLGKSFSEAAKSVGYNVKILRGIEVAEFNYTSYVQEMKEADIKFVYFVAATPMVVRLAQAFQQQSWKPEVLIVTQTQYTDEFVELGGSAINGTYLALAHPLFTTPGNKEMANYLGWLNQTRPGSGPTSFGVFSWSAARLFTTLASELRENLTRENLLAAIKKQRKWTGLGMHPPMDVGGKQTYTCATIARLKGSTWRKANRGEYACGDLVRTSVAKG